MAGWALFAGIAAIVGILLWRLRFPRGLRNFVLAAIMLGAAGYAWQGQPGWAGKPAQARVADTALDDETLGLRNAMFGRFGSTATYLVPADALLRYGAPDAAAQMIQGGINREPGNIALWTQLGVIIAARDKACRPRPCSHSGGRSRSIRASRRRGSSWDWRRCAPGNSWRRRGRGRAPWR